VYCADVIVLLFVQISIFIGDCPNPVRHSICYVFDALKKIL
jgi:hypothetical protein